MNLLRKLFGDDGGEVDYYREGVELMRSGNHHEALTSFRLALRASPGDPTVLQQIAIAYTRIGMTDEAVKTYRNVLERDPEARGAQYGLAFLLLRQGETEEAATHLRSFLADPPDEPDAGRHVEHARQTLDQLEQGDAVAGGSESLGESG